MKTSVNILISFLTISLSSSLSFGQNVSQKLPQNKQKTILINKDLLPSGFMAGLHIQNSHSRYNDKSTLGFTYHVDTAVVYSNTINPQRYIYFYDSDGNKITSHIELMNNGNWENVSMDTATYDSVGNKQKSSIGNV